MITVSTNRPRNVDALRAAANSYSDWGTSKAYMIGWAFAVAGYSSFWRIGARCVLTAQVGVKHIVICRHYPDGGGVYASVRHRSEVISIVGAFLLLADWAGNQGDVHAAQVHGSIPCRRILASKRVCRKPTCLYTRITPRRQRPRFSG